MQKRRNRPRRPGARALLAMLALAVVAVLLVGRSVLVVSDIRVEGNRFVPASEIVALSGITQGQGLLSVDTKKATAAINANRYLTVVSLRREPPNRVIITIKEHAPAATLTHMGMLLLLDDRSVLLDQTAQMDIDLSIPYVTGVQVLSARVGEPVRFASDAQGQALSAVLTALYDYALSEEVSELNVSQLDNLYLVTNDGLQVALGSKDQIDKKMILLSAVLPTLRTHSHVRGGFLDVTTALSADFKPAATPTPVPPTYTKPPDAT